MTNRAKPHRTAIPMANCISPPIAPIISIFVSGLMPISLFAKEGSACFSDMVKSRLALLINRGLIYPNCST